MKTFLITFLLAIILLIACKKESTETDNLTGVWIESLERLDTISFVSFADTKEKFLDLKVPKEANGSFKYGTGNYSMKIKTDSVNLYWMLSASSLTKYYYFKSNPNSFDIGNFYKYDVTDSVLHFEKLK